MTWAGRDLKENHHRVPDWFGLEGILRMISRSNPFAVGRTLQDQIVQNPVQPGRERRSVEDLRLRQRRLISGFTFKPLSVLGTARVEKESGLTDRVSFSVIFNVCQIK